MFSFAMFVEGLVLHLRSAASSGSCGTLDFYSHVSFECGLQFRHTL